MVFGFLKRRREKQERQAELRQMGELFADGFKADLNLFLAMEVAPTREAFQNVLVQQLAQLDKRIDEFDEEVSREDLARLDFQILVENWVKRRDQRVAAASEWLSEHFETAEIVGTREEMEQYMQMALADQDMKLYAAGIEATAAAIGEAAVADLR